MSDDTFRLLTVIFGGVEVLLFFVLVWVALPTQKWLMALAHNKMLKYDPDESPKLHQKWMKRYAKWCPPTDEILMAMRSQNRELKRVFEILRVLANILNEINQNYSWQHYERMDKK